jgi:hypothetical protein
MEENEKTQKKVDNSNYRERFQFQLRVNDNIICQRYFKIIRYNSDSICSRELYNTLDNCVRLIQNDLEYKSRVYMWNVSGGKSKLTGYAKDENGNPINPVEYIDVPAKEWDEDEFVKPWDVTFSFSFLVDDNVVYNRIWDGSQYPKYVRNSVDITNSKSPYIMVQIMNNGREDLVVDIINSICEVCSNEDSETINQYVKFERYGNDGAFNAATKKGGSVATWDATNIVADKVVNLDKYPESTQQGRKLTFTPYNREYVNMWRAYCAAKYGAQRKN